MSTAAEAPRARFPSPGFLELMRKSASLVVLMALVLAGRELGAPVPGAIEAVLGLGLLLLAGDIAADLVERIGLPHLTGYIAAGLLVGPHVLGAVPEPAVQALQPVNALALALIALSAGAELTWPLLTQGARSLLASVGAQLLLVLPGSMAVLLLLKRYLPFLNGMDWAAALAVALIWGVIAVSRSPSATLGVLAQLRPEGPLTRYTLAVVIAFDLVVLVLFAFARNIASVCTEPGAVFSLAALHELGVGLLGSVACGTTLGLLVAFYLRLVGRELLLFLLVVGYGATELASYFHYETMLLFLTAGFVVANISRQGERLLDAVAAGGRVIYVIFFALTGAAVDIRLLARIWPVALALVAVRAVLTVFSAKLGSRWAGDPPMLRRYGWMPLISQAGVTLGMAVAIAEQFPRFGPGLAALIIAVVSVNQAVGPILFKWSLDKTGETGKGAGAKTPHPQPAVAAVELAGGAS